jgi:hypothetical protein
MQLTIKWFKLFLFLCKKYYKLLVNILISLIIIKAQAIKDTSIDGIITEIYDNSKFYTIDANSKAISLGMIPTLGTVTRGTIYATKTTDVDPAAVSIKVIKNTSIKSIVIGGTIDSTHASNKKITKQSGLIIAPSNSISNSELIIQEGITIEPQGIMLADGLPGVKAGAGCIKIKQPISSDINNFGVLESNLDNFSKDIQCSAISISGAANLVNGTITNHNIITSKEYSLLSIIYNKADKSTRKFNFINNPTATVIGSIKLCGDNCKITNLGNIGQENATVTKTNTSLIFEFATVTIDNKKLLSLVAIQSANSDSILINSDLVVVVHNAKVSKLNNLINGRIAISGVLNLTEESTNSGTMQLHALTTAATINNYGSITVQELNNCVINNQASLTVIQSIKNKVTISGSLQLKGSISQQGNLQATHIIGATATLINSGSINITNNINLAKIVNNSSFITDKLTFDTYIATKTYHFVNKATAKAKVKHLKNINIKNSGKFLVLNTIEGTVQVEGNISIATTNIGKNDSLIADYLNGTELHNKGNVYINNNTNLSSLHNDGINSVLTSKTLLRLEKKSKNKGKLNIGVLTTSADKGNELVNHISGELYCHSIYNARILNNGGKITITDNIGGEVSITSDADGQLLFKDNITNTANLVIDSKIDSKSSLTNRGSITIIQDINLTKLDNSNNLTIGRTLTLAKHSINSGNLMVNTLVNSALITNHDSGQIVITNIKDSAINNTSSNPNSVLIKHSIIGEVTIMGYLTTIATLTQEGSLNAGTIIGNNFNAKGNIQAKNIKLNKLITYKTSKINLINELFVNSATNIGTITTYKLVTNGVFYNQGNLNIGHTEFFIQEGSLINNGFVSCKGSFIVAGTITNNGTLELAELKGLNKYNVIKGENHNAKVGISKLISGNFVIHQDAYLTGDTTISGVVSPLNATPKKVILQVTPITITNTVATSTIAATKINAASNTVKTASNTIKPVKHNIVKNEVTHSVVHSSTLTTKDNFIIKSLSGKKFNLTIAPRNKVHILNNVNIGSINNHGITRINDNLFLYAQESTNSGYLSAAYFSSMATLTNIANATATFATIKQAIITTNAIGSKLEVSETLDSGVGTTYIQGTLYFTGNINQSGNLNVEQIQGRNHLLKVSRYGNIIANTITLKALKNSGHITVHDNIFIKNSSTNTGTITTNKFTCYGSLCNKDGTLICDIIEHAQEINGGKIVVNSAITGDAVINSCVSINKQLKLADKSSLVVEQLVAHNNEKASFIIGKQATATIKQMLADNQLNIINRGAVKLKGGSAVQSYFGDNQSQLYLTVPIRKLTATDEALLIVKESFICNTAPDIPAIIITAETPPPKSYLNNSFEFTVFSTNKLHLEASTTNLLAVQKVKSSSILLYIDIDSPHLITDKETIKLAVRGTWLDVAKISSIQESPIALHKLGKLLQTFTRGQCKNAALTQLGHYISLNKFRPDSKKLLDYLLEDHSSETEINMHLQQIQNAFFINVNKFAKNPVSLLQNLAEYQDYKQYLPNKPLTPLLPRDIYDLIEQVLVDNSDVIDIANSENLSHFFTSISNRLSIQNKTKVNKKHKRTQILHDKNYTYGWSSFSNQKTKDVIADGYMLNNYTVNLMNLGVDRVFNKLHLGWMLGYAHTQVTNLGTQKTPSNRNHTYDFKTNASAIYANYNFDVTSANLIFIFGQSQQQEKYILLQEEFNSNFTSNLIASMGEFIYKNNINKLYFDIASRFELHYIDTPQYSCDNKILITKPTIQANIKQRTVSHRINLGCELSLYYAMNLSNYIDTKYLLSVRYIRNFNLRKDRLQQIEFFKGLFNIQQKDYSKNNIYLNFLVQMNIQKTLSLSMGIIASHKDYSKSLGFTAALQYNF